MTLIDFLKEWLITTQSISQTQQNQNVIKAQIYEAFCTEEIFREKIEKKFRENIVNIEDEDIQQLINALELVSCFNFDIANTAFYSEGNTNEKKYIAIQGGKQETLITISESRSCIERNRFPTKNINSLQKDTYLSFLKGYIKYWKG